MKKPRKQDRALEDGSGASTADFAVEGRPDRAARGVDAPYARQVEPSEGKHDHLAEKVEIAGDRQEALLDEALEETFPSSDPISPKRLA